MLENWIDPKHQGEEENFKKLSEDAAKNIEISQPTPTKDILGAETKEYIESRFPKTNDDNLQEAVAIKFATDSNFLESLHQSEQEGSREYEGIVKKLWDMYEKQLEAGAYLEVHKNLNKNVSKLIENLQILELRKNIKSNFNLTKSDTSNEEVIHMTSDEIQNIKNELDTIKNEEISKESVGQVFEKYSNVIKKYNNLNSILGLKNPELN